ncbi:cytochrome P450 family protein [Micromonospora sp. KLBMP9576]|uniref:cytochrome P450 family protein n=1 Tax=Micromonospora sp. KLBMP9576 TaxID=3424769 RepID=UPI003D93976B
MADKCPVHGHEMLLDDDYYASPYAPYALYASLHREGPVHRTCLDDNSPVWLVTGYDEVHAGLRDRRLARPREFANDDFTTKRFPEGEATGTIVTTDPPEHTRLKRMVNFTFLPRNVETFRPRVHELVNTRLDEIEAAGGGDLVEDYAAALPITIICDVLGIPDNYRKELKHWADLAFGGDDATNAVTREQLSKFVNEVRMQKAQEPGTDLMSYWIHAKNADGEPELSVFEVMSLALLTLLGGYDTTAGMISRGALALLDNPETLARLREDPDLFDVAVEEMLRMYGSVHHGFRRFATEAMEIGGTRIGKGDTVYLHLTAAGNDPKRFADPHVLDIDRADKAHLAFGGGAHFCSGSELARIETTVALRTLFTRFPDIKLAAPRDSLKLRHSPLMPALMHLPVTV